MADSKLCLLLLLSTSALACEFFFRENIPFMAKRYKTLHKYEYRYEAESLNGINGASELKNGPKASCMVEIEVPQTCSFIVRTTGCSLSEVVDMDAEGNPVFGPAPSSAAFAAEMERYPLKVVVDGVYDVKLYPEDGESTTILNFKRGIISALAVPLLEEDKNKYMPTIHGKCRTRYVVNAAANIATDVSLSRDLSRCDKFVPMRDYTSPLALISGMHYPLAQLIRSSQTCNYRFNNRKKHMTFGSCTEKHILIPFSHKGEYGVTNVGKQELTLVQVSSHNDRVFHHGDTVKGLHMEAVGDKSFVQDRDVALNLLRELATLPQSSGEKRAHLFHKLVTAVRGMKAETLRPAIPDALAVSRVLTYQVLAQCGTPECSSAIMQIFRTFDSSSLEVDAGVFALGLISNPSALLINDMLEMAKFKLSKPIMYALSNVVKRFYKAEGKLIPEIHSVAEFMAARLDDCSGDMDNTFMTLRVSISVYHSTLMLMKPAASPAVQQAAIQVYRLTSGREVLMQVLLDRASPMQKRIAAYLVLMKDPQPTELSLLADVLSKEQDQQVRSFVESHIINIMSTTELRQKIRNALQDNEIGTIMDPTKFSRNYKIGSVEGNMIFDGTSYLPKEVMLEMTLKAFGYDIDMMEIGMEGKGFEPTVEALFGKDGFFPDTVLKTMYFVSDHMPLRLNEILQNMVPNLKRNKKRAQVLQAIYLTGESPEAMVYLRLLGNELGYLRTNELAYSLMKALLTKTDNTIFAHYIFMDNEFFLPTVTGVPLRIALSGTFTPGIKGGLKIARDMVTFMPSAGVEFVTQIGSHIPEYINSGLEMHTNVFHESGLHAKMSMGPDSVKLTIPAPTSPTKLFQMKNTLVAVTGSEMKTIPPMVMDKVDLSECTPAFAGMKYCTALQYVNAYSQETAPYFPFTGDSKFVVELHPTGEVTEYTATVAYELLKEGDEGRQKVDSVKFVLRAEGSDPTEARAVVKYNRKKNVITADVEIPDYDVEAGVRLGVVDGNTKGRGTHAISLDFVNKNVPKLSLVGRANLKAMKEGMLQVQLLVPSISADATVTANMKRDEELELELKSEIKVMDATSEQEIAMKYDASKIEVEFKSDVNTDTTSLPNSDLVMKYGNEILDMQVGQTDMKVRHIFTKYIYLHFVNILQNIYAFNFSVFNSEAKAVYHFNNERVTIVVPLPLGGKSREELRFPPALSTPHVSLPHFGLEIVSMEVPIPQFVVPERITLSIPLFGKAELSTSLKSNLYNMEASTPSYSAMFDMKGTSPLDILSMKIEGSGKLVSDDSIKAHLKSSFAHKFIEASIDIVEEATIRDKIDLISSSKIEAASPLGLSFQVQHTLMTGVNTLEISSNSNFRGGIKAGPMYGSTISTQAVIINPFISEAKIDSFVDFDCNLVRLNNKIAASIAKGEFSIQSNTVALEDSRLKHAAELSFKNNKLSVKSDANVLVLGMNVHNQAEASAGTGEVVVRMETNADHSENRVYSLVTARLDVNGLVVNSNANVKLLENEGTHKTILTMNKDGLVLSGENSLQSPLAMENTFSAEVDASKAILFSNNKATMSDISVDYTNTLAMTFSSLDLYSKAEATASESASYSHDISINLKPYTASANVKNKLILLMANIVNDAQLQVEPYKLDLTGSLKAIVDEEEIKHTYQVNYADMTANAKCSTTGKLFGTHMSHNAELEVVGLAARITSDCRFNSQSVRFDHNIRSSIVPFDFNLDAIFNADGDLIMYGKHSGQLYGKVLLRAQPLAFASSHECRASLTQTLDNGFCLETTFDNKMNNVLTLDEQKTSFKMKSKVNEHAFTQDVSVYNTAERTGVEASGTILTNIFNKYSTENQEYTMSGFVKYDKNTDSHIINFPFMENMPVFLESIKGMIVHIAEALFRNVSEIISQLNAESHLIQLKEYFSDFTQTYVISVEDVETSLRELQVTVEKLMVDLTVYIKNFSIMMKESILSGTLSNTLIQKIDEQLIAINEEYDIKAKIVYVIDTMSAMLNEIDLQKLKGSSIAFLYDIDATYYIKARLQAMMRDLKHMVERFDINTLAAQLKNAISFFCRATVYIGRLVGEKCRGFFKNTTDFFIEIIKELDIVGKLNTGYAKIRELIVKFEADKIALAILENTVELIKQFRIEETIRTMSKMVMDVHLPTKVTQDLQHAINYLKETEIKDLIRELNKIIEKILRDLKSLDYNDFVYYANDRIDKYTKYVNNLIRTLEIPQKLEATRNFANLVVTSAKSFSEHLREMKVAEIIKSLEDISDHLVLENLRDLGKFVKQKITNFDVKKDIASFLKLVGEYYRELIDITTEMLRFTVDKIKGMLPKQKIISEINQICRSLIFELRRAEMKIPSFVIPFTDLVVPSWEFTIDELQYIEIPAQLDIPEFTILGFHIVKATTISFDDIKEKIIQFIDFFLKFEIKMLEVDALFGELSLNFLPPMPKLTLPEITLPEISFPTIPQVPVEKLVKSLQIPEIKLPTIPSEIMAPCFGKLYGEIKFHTPIYTVKTSAEIQNSTENEMTPTFTGLLTSQATSPTFEVLNYKLDSTARIAIPKMSRIVLAETLTIVHQALNFDHQASIILYGLSAQAQAKTAIKVTTSPYGAQFMNTAFIAIEKGMSASLDTTYNHLLDLPIVDIRSEVDVNQNAIVRQNGYTITLTIDNSGNGKFNDDDGNHKSNIHLSLTPSVSTLTFSGDTDSTILKMKQQIAAEIGTLAYLKFNIRNEAEAPVIKNSLIVASGYANLYEMKVVLKANHDTELYGDVSGALSNGLNIVAQPAGFVFEFQNKGNAKVNIFETITAKIDLQNDYTAMLKPDSQQLNTVALVRLNQNKLFYNFTFDNNENEAGVFVSMESDANLDFLTSPISIPEIDLPFVDFRTPAVSDLNLYEQTGLKNILTTTKQTVNIDAKVVYQKSQGAPLVDMMGMIQIPSVGNLITDLSLKSAIINLNVNAGMHAEDDLVVRLRATTASVFEGLKAKLDGTTSLTTKRGIKLASSLSLENPHIEGTHESTISVSTETFDTFVSVATVAKINLPILNLEVSQNLVKNTKTKTIADSNISMKGDFNIPVIKAVGKANANCVLTLEGTFDRVSMDLLTRANLDGTVLEDFLVFGALDNDNNLYLNNDGIRSTSKVTAEGKLHYGTTRVFNMDVNETLAVEASLSRVFAVLKYTSNNEANMFNFNTNGKQAVQAAIDFAPISSLTANIEIDISQPSSLGEFTILVKNVAEVAFPKQMISSNVKFVSPVYTTNLEAAAEGMAPVFKVTFKSSANSVVLFLDYDMVINSCLYIVGESARLMTGKHQSKFNPHLLIIIQKLIVIYFSFKMLFFSSSSSYHTVNVDITSLTFSDVNLRYAARRDEISASVSTPAAGFLGLQFNGRVPSQMRARIYGRYPSAPDVDVDMLVIKSSSVDADMMKVQVDYNMEAPKAILSELKMKLPSIISTLKKFADNYQNTRSVEELKNAAVKRLNEVYNAAIYYDIQMSELSIFFRNFIVEYQKTVQVFLEAVIKVLRETQFKLPGSDELTTLPKVLKKLTSSVAAMLDMAIEKIYEKMEVCYNWFVEKISNVKVSMPVGDVITGNQILGEVKVAFRSISDGVVGFVKNMESLDTMLVMIGENLKAVVEKSQELVDSVKSDYLDAIVANINIRYREHITVIKNVVDQIDGKRNSDPSVVEFLSH
uniref:Vitellogenin domain-containing protein n=1 Tax=Mola mola TaxID=94237 RepID=A0A3Q3VRN1_MOLML